LTTDQGISARYLNRAEAAAYLNVTPRWLATGGYRVVPSLKFGRLVRYDPAELDRWAAEQRPEVR
jgi:hypothetical protein